MKDRNNYELKVSFPMKTLEKIIWENQEYLKVQDDFCKSEDLFWEIPGFLHFWKDVPAMKEGASLINENHIGMPAPYSKNYLKLKKLIENLYKFR